MIYLVQIDGYDPVAGAAVTVRLSSVDDDRVCHLDAVNGVWWPSIATLPELRYDILDGGFSGKITTPESSIVMAIEPWPNFPRYNLSDARVRIYEGNAGDAWGAWTLRYDGRSKSQPNISAGRASLTFGVDDAWLDKPLLTLFAGTGGAEGDAPLKGVPKPLALGAPRFTPGLLVDTNNLIFQVSAYGLIEDVEVAFERILRFQASAGDHANHAALAAAVIPAGAWGTCKAEGKIRHGAPPIQGGRFVYHVKGDKAGPDGWVRLPGQIIKRLALIGGGTGRFSEASVDALDIARPWNVSFFSNQQLTVRDAIYRVAASVNAVAGVDWLGRLVVWPLPSLAGAPAVTLDATGASLPPVAKVEQIPVDPPYWQMAIETEKTWDVHDYSDIAFTAVLADRGDYSATETYREGNLVKSQGVQWLYVNATAGAGNAPPTMPTTSNAWWKMTDPKLGGVAENAGTSVTFLSAGPGAQVVQGNKITRPVQTGLWDVRTYSQQPQVGTGFWQFKIPASVNNDYLVVGVSDAPATIVSNDAYLSILGIYSQGASNVIGWDSNTTLAGFTSAVANAADDVWSIQYDGNAVRIYQTTSAGVTTLRGSKTVGPGRSLHFAAVIWSAAPTAAVSDIIISSGPERYLDTIVDGATYGRLKLVSLTGGELRLETAGGGRRLGDIRNLPNILGQNLNYTYGGTISYTATAGTPATATISITAGNLLSGPLTISYNALSVGVTGTGGTNIRHYLYVVDPTNAGGAATLVSTTSFATLLGGTGNVYLGYCDVFFPSVGSGGGGGVGGQGCVWVDAWVPTRDRDWVRAGEIVPGDFVRALPIEGGEFDWVEVEAIDFAFEECVLVTAANGFQVTISWSTPITLRDGTVTHVLHIPGQELPIDGPEGLDWSRCVIEPVGRRRVAKIRCHQRTYSAGDVAGRGILTHNPKP